MNALETRSRFVNPHGYRLDDKHLVNGQMLRHFRLDPVPAKRLMYYSARLGLYLQPNMGFFTDGFSAPPIVYYLIPSLKPFGRYKRPGFLHDSSYKDKGLFASETISGPFVRYPMTRLECDDLLHDMCLTEGAWEIEADGIWLAVHGAGWQYYGRGDMKCLCHET
jgi:hypothetical protein